MVCIPKQIRPSKYLGHRFYFSFGNDFFQARTFASADGQVKFWKKGDNGIEFIKHFRTHSGKNCF